MASPFLESFCCMFNLTSTPMTIVKDTLISTTKDHHRRIRITSQEIEAYNVLTILSSSLGILGALYQLWPKLPQPYPRGRRELLALHRQNTIVCYLAFADLMAASVSVASAACVAGILVRSVVWLADFAPLRSVSNSGHADFAHLFCAISSGWIQYFFVTSYLWTFCYALDTYLITKKRPGYPTLYQLISWMLSAIICMTGLISLYKPSLLKCARSPASLLPHYLSSYVPMILVILINPVLYKKASKAVEQSLQCHGQFTDHERRILSAVRNKFFLVMLVFCICWFPNILMGCLLLFPRQVGDKVLLALWQYMAIVNPVQALLNACVYGGVGCQNLLRNDGMESTPSGRPSNHIQSSSLSTEVSSETSPLLLH